MSAPDWESLDRLFAQASELPAHERAAFLDRACADDPELRAELASLLDDAEEADRFFDALGGAMLSLPADPGDVPDAQESDADRLTDLSLGQYRIRRKIGVGGMGIVYEAHDTRLDRKVALKFLPLHAGADKETTERFLVEARAAAVLDHPNVCTVYEIGEDVDGRWFIALPYYEGETLAEKLGRGPLPLEEALEYFRQVAAGLAAAHARGVMHRDIKPGNVMVTRDGVAKVLDFGLAKLEGVSRTAPGETLGTVPYMSPERIRGEAVDERTDLWSLGVLLYEMLTGELPFKGDDARPVLQGILDDEPESLKVLGVDVPGEVEAVLRRLLAKEPEERDTTAEKLARWAADQVHGALTPRKRSPPPLTAALVAAGLVGGGWWLSTTSAARQGSSEPAASAASVGVPGYVPGEPDPSVVAVFPFRVSDADAALAYLEEGVVDALAATLTGEIGPRAVDPRTSIGAWRRAGAAGDAGLAEPQLLHVARTLGAGLLIAGAVSGSPDHLVIDAALTDAVSGEITARATVGGPETKLGNLVELARARLLAGAGVVDDRAELPAGAPLGALRAYLDGQMAYRRGRYQEAASHFVRTLELDPTFALAGIGLASAAAWSLEGEVPGVFEAKEAAWSARGSLGARDLAIFQARMDEEYSGISTLAGKVTAWVEALRAAPERAESWYEYADLLFHRGALLGLPADTILARTAAAYSRAFQLDSAFAAPLSHLVEIAAIRKDAQGVRDLGAVYAEVDSAGETRDFIRWRSAHVIGDSAALADLRGRLAGLSVGSLARITGAGLQSGIGVRDAERAVRILSARAITPSQRWHALMWRQHLELNRGRPDTAEVIARSMNDIDPRATDRLRVYAGLYWGGQPEAAESAASRLIDRAGGPLPGARRSRSAQLRDLCAAEQWKLRNRRVGTAPAAIRRLRSSRPERDGAVPTREARLCALVLETLLSVETGHEEAPRLIRSLDSLMLTGPVGLETGTSLPSSGFDYVNLLLSELLEAEGRPDAALRAVRRRPYIFATSSVRFLSSYLRQEGRLAARLGDRDGAIRAYRHYLTLRSGAEGAAAQEVATVREELAALDGGERIDTER